MSPADLDTIAALLQAQGQLDNDATAHRRAAVRRAELADALTRWLEIILDGGPRPAAIVGMPVGFIGSAESKLALAEHRLPEGGQIPWLVVHGRRGGSAMAASALNALANASELA